MDTFKNPFPTLCRFVILILTLTVATVAQAQPSKSPEPSWSFNATIIEACSCPMFCQCYFNSTPAVHSDHGSHGAVGQHFCRFNRAFRVNKGSFGSTEFAGVKFWMAGDLGGDFSKEHMDWAVLTFEPSTTKEQRTAITAILNHIYPFTWNSFTVAPDAAMEWNASGDHAEARLDGGKTAEVVLQKAQGMTSEPITIENLKYDGAPRNEGFTLMPNKVEAYRVGAKLFEFKGTTGFMITIDMTSEDSKK
jgi:Protein of unknown function (DUF1326)